MKLTKGASESNEDSLTQLLRVFCPSWTAVISIPKPCLMMARVEGLGLNLWSRYWHQKPRQNVWEDEGWIRCQPSTGGCWRAEVDPWFTQFKSRTTTPVSIATFVFIYFMYLGTVDLLWLENVFVNENERMLCYVFLLRWTTQRFSLFPESTETARDGSVWKLYSSVCLPLFISNCSMYQSSGLINIDSTGITRPLLLIHLKADIDFL